jgi:transcriptional regulator GlxA family with amidase domain
VINVVIPALEGTASIGTAGLMDALNKADVWGALADGPRSVRLFDVRLIGLRRRPVRCRDGVQLTPSVHAPHHPIPDLVVVPGLDDDLDSSFVINRPWVPWIARWHAAGARIASSCTGAFLLADAGLLDGKPVTTHWLFAEELHERYPRVEVRADRMIIDTGDVISSGGATAFLNLVLYLVERFGGHARANSAARVLLVDGHKASQLPYLAPLPGRTHDDLVVHEIQQHIDTHLDEPIQTAKLASQFGLSIRSLNRRFTAATGSGPRAYLQQVRVRHAQRLLETTSEPVDQIRRSAGYHDPAAFRRAFKQTTGLSPNGYRERYAPRANDRYPASRTAAETNLLDHRSP